MGCFDALYDYKSLGKLISNHSMIGLSILFFFSYLIIIHMAITLIFFFMVNFHGFTFILFGASFMD
jgi:hypothetical protein